MATTAQEGDAISNGLAILGVGVILAGLALGGCRWTSDSLLLRADLAARPFETGYYLGQSPDGDDKPEIGYIEMLAGGWYRLADDKQVSEEEDTYLLLESLGSSPGVEGVYVGVWTDVSCMQGACADDNSYTYMLLVYEDQVLSSYMPNCDKDDDELPSPDRQAATQNGRASVRADGSRDECVFDGRAQLVEAMRDVAQRYAAGSLTGASSMSLRKVEQPAKH